MAESNKRSGTITKLSDQVRNPERISVFLDGVFAMGLARQVVADAGLFVGMLLDEADTARLLAADEVARATAAALQFLAYRPRSEREVRDRLRRRGFSEEAIEPTVARLHEWRYLDDAEFARFWVENRAEHRPRGRRMLRSELRMKGVDPGLVDEAIDEAGGDEVSAALTLAQQRLPRLRGLDPLTQRRRLAGFLQRRGYGWDIIGPVLSQVLGEDDE